MLVRVRDHAMTDVLETQLQQDSNMRVRQLVVGDAPAAVNFDDAVGPE